MYYLMIAGPCNTRTQVIIKTKYPSERMPYKVERTDAVENII